MLMHKYVNVNYNHLWPIFGAAALPLGHVLSVCVVYTLCIIYVELVPVCSVFMLQIPPPISS